MRRVGARIHAHDVARKAARGTPDGSVDRIDRDRVEPGDDTLVLRRIERLARLDPVVALAVAVGIQHERRPALRALLVTGLFEELAVEPAERRVAGAAGARPERVVRVLGEHQMVRAEAGADQRELAALRVVHREMAVGALERQHLRRRMARPLPAELGVARRPHARGVPDAPLLIQHRIVARGVTVPDRRRAPVGRRRHRIVLG